MSILDFPSNPNVGDEYSIGSKTWRWNGSGWEMLPIEPGGPNKAVQFNDYGRFAGVEGFTYDQTIGELRLAYPNSSGFQSQLTTIVSGSASNKRTMIQIGKWGLVQDPYADNTEKFGFWDSNYGATEYWCFVLPAAKGEGVKIDQNPLLLYASQTGYPSLRIPHGVAPSAPTNGDIWTTTAGLFARINGVTVGPFGSVADGDKGDITVTASGATWTIDADAVTYAKMQNVSAASKLLGRGDSGAGDVQEITLGANLTMTGTTLSATGGSGSPGGSNTQVQYNNAGAFGGITNLTSDGTNVTALTVAGAKANFAATAAGYASINLPHGTAPSSPANGDVWTTTDGVYVRINGTTIGPLGTGGGGGGSGGMPLPEDFWPLVSFLFHFDGTNGSTTFTDSGPFEHSVTRTGTGTISTAQSKFGGSSYLSASSSWLSVANCGPFEMRQEDFTIEGWVYCTGGSGERPIAGCWETGALSWMVTLDASRRLTFYYSTDGSTGVFTAFTSTSVPLDTWTHIYVTRSGSRLRLKIDGVDRYTLNTFSATVFPAATDLKIGGSSTASFVGYIDELRFSRFCRGIADFTPPTAPYPSEATVWNGKNYAFWCAGLFNFEGANNGTVFTDDSMYNLTMTRTGTVVTSTTQAKFGSTSGYFPGASYLTTAGSSFNPSLIYTGDFTVEMWVWTSNTPGTDQVLFDLRGSAFSDPQFALYLTGTGRFSYYDSTTGVVNGGASDLRDGAWHWVVASRRQQSISLYVDGTRIVGPTANSRSFNTTYKMRIGADHSGANALTGYIDGLRALLGVGLYEGASITVPTSPPTLLPY